MNPYNQQSYGYPQQQGPGPPQPPWQAPPRRSAWGDPRISGQGPHSPISPTYPDAPPSSAFGPPLPPPPPQQSQYPAQLPQYNTSQWGVKYNQGLGHQSQQEESRPPLPPRPTSAAGGGQYTDYGQQQQQQQQYSGWDDTYHTNNSVPPPPPPRPAEYQAQIQAAVAHQGRTSTPHQDYSHQPATHHYDPQNLWNAQPVAPQWRPTAPPAQQVTGTVEGHMVSPIEPSKPQGGGWQGHTSTTNQTQNTYDTLSAYAAAYSQALSFAGPSDWEHYNPNASSTDQTPTSPALNLPYQAHMPVSPPSTHATPAPAHQTPKQERVRPSQPVELGGPSPIIPQYNSHFEPQSSAPFAIQPQSVLVEASPQPANQYITSASARSDSLNETNNIDSVIQAWNTPLKPRHGQELTPRPASRASAARVSSPEPGSSPSARVLDPYSDLEPEFRASLNRYAAMLRKEAAASTDDEKFDLFQAFVTKELRLRSLLYGVELKNAAAKEVKKAASLADIQAMLPKSALSAAGTNADLDPSREVAGKASEPVVSSISTQSPSQPRNEHSVTHKEPPIVRSAQYTATVPLSGASGSTTSTADVHSKSKEEGYVVVAAPGGDEAYSPGGRPLMTKVPLGNGEEAYSPGGRPVATTGVSVLPAKPSVGTIIQQNLRQSTQDTLSPSADAPMVMEDYLTAQPTSPSINAPTVVTSESSTNSDDKKPVVPIKFEPARPAYTPFRYNEGVAEEKTKTLQPAEKSYSSLRNSQADSGRLLVRDPVLLAPMRPASSTGRKEHEEAFIGLIRKQSMAVRQQTPTSLPADMNSIGSNVNKSAPIKPEPPPFMRVGTPVSQPVKAQQPADVLNEAVNSLEALLPSSEDLPTPIEPSADSPALETIKSKIDSLSDGFAYIHEAVVNWDRTNRIVRNEQEAERARRQEESDARIDDLFNDNEIGYHDIGDLEAEFKLAEAEKKYQEDQAELESFTGQVFVTVTERLQKEIAELMTAYTTSIDLLDHESVAVSRCFGGPSVGAKPIRMTQIMSHVLTLFNKIELRHRKLAEAHVERERRRKHLELTVLYTNGDVAGVKQLEKEFAVAEKMAVLHEARGKDNRANKLMDCFDRATVRGLGDNQVYTDDVLVKLQDVRKAVEVILSSSTNTSAASENNNGPSIPHVESLRQTLHLAQMTLETIASDSRRVLALSSEGDILLNEADYNVSVAEARVANADKATYVKLEEEKVKEDGKLIEEMDVRVKTVGRAPGEGVEIVKGLLRRIDGGGGDVVSTVTGAPGTGTNMAMAAAEESHEERIKRALEAAKMRNLGNTGKNPGEAG